MSAASQKIIDRITEFHPEIPVWNLQGFSAEALLANYPEVAEITE